MSSGETRYSRLPGSDCTYRSGRVHVGRPVLSIEAARSAAHAVFTAVRRSGQNFPAKPALAAAVHSATIRRRRFSRKAHRRFRAPFARCSCSNSRVTPRVRRGHRAARCRNTRSTSPAGAMLPRGSEMAHLRPGIERLHEPGQIHRRIASSRARACPGTSRSETPGWAPSSHARPCRASAARARSTPAPPAGSRPRPRPAPRSRNRARPLASSCRRGAVPKRFKGQPSRSSAVLQLRARPNARAEGRDVVHVDQRLIFATALDLRLHVEFERRH